MHINKKFLSCKKIFVLSAVLCCLLSAAVFAAGGKLKAHAYKTSQVPTGDNAIVLHDGETFNVKGLQTLATTAGYADVTAMMQAATEKGSSLTSKFAGKVVTIGKDTTSGGGALSWAPVYLSRSTEDKNGDGKPDAVLTLWLATDIYKAKWSDGTSSSSATKNFTGSDGTVRQIYSNTYDGSYIRHMLNGKTGWTTNWSSDPVSANEAIRTMVSDFCDGPLKSYVTTPANVRWQSEAGYMKNDPKWSGEGYEGYPSDWLNDNVWLPSMYEVRDSSLKANSTEDSRFTNNGGLWQVKQDNVDYSNANIWLRSACNASKSESFFLYFDRSYPLISYTGVGYYAYGVRPAIHINLASVTDALPKYEITFSANGSTFYKDDIAAAFNIANTATQSATVKLLDDAETSETLRVTKNVILDLNQCVLRSGGVQVEDGGSFTLTDAGKYTVDHDVPVDVQGINTYRVSGGVVTGGGVRVRSGGSFTMNKGSIVGCSTSGDGGGVYVASGGSFIMSGGRVDYNKAARSGGGIFLEQNATFTMRGGSVLSNEASSAAGVAVGAGCTFNLSCASGNGSDIFRNKLPDGTASNVCLPKGTSLTVNGTIEGYQAYATVHVTLASGESLVATGFTSENNPKGRKASQIFVPDGEQNCVYVSNTENGTVTFGVHEGGTATCGAKAVCRKCGEEYGDTDSNNHDYGAPTYTWSDDDTTCTAERVCSYDGSHKETETVTATSATTAPTCTAGGYDTLTATFTNTAFATQTKQVNETDAKGHSYGTPTYTWLGDSCTAERICTNDGNHKETETVTATSVTTAPTCTAGGYDTLTATFANTAFAAQTTKANETTAKGHSYGTPTYTWSGNGCTAERACTNDGSHKETETVTATSATTAPTCTAGGYDTLTATFTNTAFTAQTTKANETDALGHDYTGAWMWADDGKTATLTLTCGRDGCTHSAEKHIASVGVKSKDPTCTQKGETTYTATYVTTADDNSAAQKTFTDTKTVADIAALGHDYTGAWTWADDGKTATLTLTCGRDGCTHSAEKQIASAGVKSKDPTCTQKGETTCTATYVTTASDNSATEQTFTDTKTVADIAALGHTVTGFAVVNGNSTYLAFDTFDLTGAEVYTHCARENCDCEDGRVKKIDNTDITVAYYTKDGWLHCGDPYVTLKATADGVFLSDMYSVRVGKRTVTVTWEYTVSPVSDENAWVWTPIADGAFFTYDGTSKAHRVRARFTGAALDPDKDAHYYRATSEYLLADGSLEDAEVYALSLDASKFSEYTFENNGESIEIKPYGIRLDDADVYRWTLGKEQGSLLRDGYVKEEDGKYVYYANESEGGKHVTRSVVRYRGDDSGLRIMLNGGEIADLFAGAGKRSSIAYSGTTDVGAVGKYTAIATLELNDKTNYRYTGEITVATDRGMTVIITENGTKAVITKEWYVAAIDNGLLSADGGEYRIDDRTFGADTAATVPKLEHGDEAFDVGNISPSDRRIAFGLFTDADLTERIGETFYRYNFGAYINGSMPSGKYYLRASVTGVKDADGVEYRDFTRTFTFEVERATLDVTDGLNGKTFIHAYNGKVQLYGVGAEPTVTEPLYLNGADRIGIWQAADFDGYYGGAYMTFHLARWHAAAAGEHEYVTVTQLNNTLGKKQAPREADTYTVYYRINARNYNVYGVNNDKTFTVTITKQALSVPSDREVTYDGEEHVYAVSDDAPYSVQGAAAYVDANEDGYTIALALKDGDNYEWKDAVGSIATVKLIINKADYDMRGVTFGDLDVLYDGTEHMITVAGLPDGVTYASVGATEVGVYALTVGFTGDARNYNAIPNMSVTLVIRAPQLIKPDENGGENQVIVTLPDGFMPDIQLVVTKIERENYGAYETIAKAANGKIGLVYDVTLKSNGVSVQPDGMLTIQLRIPENLKGKKFTLFHLHGDTATDMEYTLDGNYAVVTTDTLSEFVFVGEKSTRAFDLLWLILLIILSIVVAGEIGYIVHRKVRKNRATEEKL